MTRLSSIHVRPVLRTSESHNQRLREMRHCRPDLADRNEAWVGQSIAECRREIEARYQATTRQKMQRSATPIREGVLLVEDRHSIHDLLRLAERLQERFGLRTIQAYLHRDEGHTSPETGEWKPNLHAHLVFDWTDPRTGKSLKLGKEDMAEMQTIVADELGLQRGEKSTKQHIEATRYRAMKEREELATWTKGKGTLRELVALTNQVRDRNDKLNAAITEREEYGRKLLAAIAQEKDRLRQLQLDIERLDQERQKKRGMGR